MFRRVLVRVRPISSTRRLTAQGSSQPPVVATHAGTERDNILYAPLDGPRINPLVAKALSFENASKEEIRKSRLRQVVQEFQRSESDTGSPEVQVAILTERIRALTTHMQAHRQDKHTERGLVQLVHKRRSMMKYLLRQSPERYLENVRRLGLRETTVFSKDLGVLGAKNKPSPKLRRDDDE